MVDRFQMKTEHGWICARPDEKGDWVRYSDYEAALRAGGEPVAWQWRSRVKGGAWDAWESGRYGQTTPPFMDVEERPLYAHPAPSDLERELDEARADDDGAMTPEEIRLEDLKQMAQYDGPIVSFEFRAPYYLASCDKCGWVGSSEHCGTDSFGDDSDVYCPRCHASGADCGKIASALSGTSDPAEKDLPKHMKFRRDAMLLAMTMDGGDFAGDIDPVDENTVEGLARTLAIVAAAYDWTVDNNGSLAGLVAGDQGFASTSIVCKDASSVHDPAEAKREALEEAATDDGLWRFWNEKARVLAAEKARVIEVGKRLANVAFNIHQQGRADAATIRSLKAAQVEWDAALSSPITEGE